MNANTLTLKLVQFTFPDILAHGAGGSVGESSHHGGGDWG